MARGNRGNRGIRGNKVFGLNYIHFKGTIKNYWEGKDDKHPDKISLEIPFTTSTGDTYPTRVNLTLWVDDEMEDFLCDNDIKEGSKIEVICYCTCPKATDYTPQFTIQKFALAEEEEEDESEKKTDK